MIVIIDYDIGNLAAISNMLKKNGFRSRITSDPEVVSQADRIILPGNGAFDACMQGLFKTGLVPLIKKMVFEDKVPLLGICVGAQMLGHSSEEGVEQGLGWVDMTVTRFPNIETLPVPHMGWRNVEPANNQNPILSFLEPSARFYFVHSYFMKPKNSGDILLTASYGSEFAAAVSCGNITGVQFHPEKSHRFGQQLFEGFVKG